MLETEERDLENEPAGDGPEFDDCTECGSPVLVLFGPADGSTKCLDCGGEGVE